MPFITILFGDIGWLAAMVYLGIGCFGFFVGAVPTHTDFNARAFQTVAMWAWGVVWPILRVFVL